MKNKGLLKKTIAAVLGITMAFGALMLPGDIIKDEFTQASAYHIDIGSCNFDYGFLEEAGPKKIKIYGVSFTGDTVEVPSTINHEGVDYPVVEIGANFLKDNKEVKTVIIPDSVTRICQSVLYQSYVERIVLSNNLEHIGDEFAYNCPYLTSVECTSTKVKPEELGFYVLGHCTSLKNEKGAVCLGNWLIEYESPKDDPVAELKVADLGNNGVKIDSVANKAVAQFDHTITTLDLEGVKYVGERSFTNLNECSAIKNTDSIISLGQYPFHGTQWIEDIKVDNVARMGSVLVYYKTDDNVLDLTSGKLEGIQYVYSEGLQDCKNLDTIICNSDCVFGEKCFYKSHDPLEYDETAGDPLPKVPTYNIKTVYVDDKEVTNAVISTDKAVSEWLRYNNYELTGSIFIKNLVDEKVKTLFKQMDITYYGPGNDKMGTHTPTEEFYIRMKIHDYMSLYDYDHEYEYGNEIGSFLVGGKLNCSTYATITQYLLECAGVEAKTLAGISHFYNSTKIGDEWFEFDDGWDAQNFDHGNGWFGRSTKWMTNSYYHECQYAYDNFHDYYGYDNKSERITAERTIGDIDGNSERNADDVALLWGYLKNETRTINKKAADINFDGKIDVTDGVLLDHFVNQKAIDPNNVPTDGFAPGYWVAFVYGNDYNNIKYLRTDREGYIVLRSNLFEAPEGKKIRYDIGKAGEKVRITNPCTVVTASWVDKNAPDYILGDVNGDSDIDIEDAVAIIQHINGMTPLTGDQELSADVSKDKKIDIDDAVTLISYINGNSTF